MTWHLSAVKGTSWCAGDDFSKELYKAQELLDLVTVYVHVQINLNDQVDMIQNSISDLDNLGLSRARKPWENVCAAPWKWVLASVQVPVFLIEPTAIWFQASSLISSMELNLQQEIIVFTLNQITDLMCIIDLQKSACAQNTHSREIYGRWEIWSSSFFFTDLNREHVKLLLQGFRTVGVMITVYIYYLLSHKSCLHIPVIDLLLVPFDWRPWWFFCVKSPQDILSTEKYLLSPFVFVLHWIK